MRKFFVGFLLVFALVIMCSHAYAEPSISYTATNVYWYEAEKLAVEGYFYNNGTKTIDGITYFELTIHFYNPKSGQYQWLGRGIWQDQPKLLDVSLNPGEVSYWTFYIDTEGYPRFTDWKYKWYAKYNYIK